MACPTRFLSLLSLAVSPLAAQAPTAAPPAVAPSPAPAAPITTVPAAPPARAAALGFGDRKLTFFSPMGEPFRGTPGGTAPDQLWFTQADRNHDGRLTLVEMRADAYRFFKTLDLNHDGEIDPTELEHYETDVAPEINVQGDGGRGGGGGGGGGKRGGGKRGRGGGGREREPEPAPTNEDGTPAYRPAIIRGAGLYGLFDLPEPVIAADADLNRGVSIREFDAAAQKRFLLLDTAHAGYLSYPALHAMLRR